MRRTRKIHSEENRNGKRTIFALILMLILFSFCGCGETTNAVLPDSEEELSENRDMEDTDRIASAEQTKEDSTTYDDQVKEDPVAAENQTNSTSDKSESAEDSEDSAKESVEEPAAALTEESVEGPGSASAKKNEEEPAAVSTEENTEEPTVVPTGENVEEPAVVSAGTDYILNMNTKKFHYPDCSSVGQMAEKNKWAYTGSRDDVIAMGYVPCKRCNP